MTTVTGAPGPSHHELHYQAELGGIQCEVAVETYTALSGAYGIALGAYKSAVEYAKGLLFPQ